MAFTIVLATRNADKVKEIRAILSHLDVELKDLTEFPGCPEVEEDGDTLEANALKKARAVAQFTKLPAVADDTGLEAYYLLGAPGVHTARYAGPDATYEDNYWKLLRELNQVSLRHRGARFRTVVAFVFGKQEQCFEGKIEGTISFTPRGTGGFGYDPVFIPEGERRTFAELPPETKNGMSHRAIAFRAFAEHLATIHN